jgi:hypothetical protein
MVFERKFDFDLAGRVSFRIPVSVREAIQVKAEKEQRTISDLLRDETISKFGKKTS